MFHYKYSPLISCVIFHDTLIIGTIADALADNSEHGDDNELKRELCYRYVYNLYICISYIHNYPMQYMCMPLLGVLQQGGTGGI